MDTTLRIDWHEAFPAGADPFSGGADEISQEIVEGPCESIGLVAPGVTKFVLRP